MQSAIATIEVTGPRIDDEERAQVWADLSQWEFGSPKATEGFTFKDKLVKKTGWSEEYAARVIEEFRRFVFLWICNTDIRFVPSPDVDEAWHLAILFLRPYVRMCKKFLGGIKWHSPSTSEEDRLSLRQSYGETLQLYVEIFGEQPPTDIWTGQNTADCNESGVIPCGINACSGDCE